MPGLDPTERLLDFRAILQALTFHARGQFLQGVEQATFGVGHDGLFFVPARLALAQHDPFGGAVPLRGSLRVRQHANQDRFFTLTALHNLETLRLPKRGEIALALSAAVVDEIAKTMLMQQL